MPDDLQPPLLLSENWIHMGLGATSVPQPPFTGMEWYQTYGERYSSDGAEGRLVSMHTFSESWDVWEMHPVGSELVLVIDGEVSLIQEIDGEPVTTTAGAGSYVINPAGVWHTADVAGPATVLFITAGMGTEHRPR